jgi:hypothetical protein
MYIIFVGRFEIAYHVYNGIACIFVLFFLLYACLYQVQEKSPGGGTFQLVCKLIVVCRALLVLSLPPLPGALLYILGKGCTLPLPQAIKGGSG